jgi:hypothetical protein
MSELVTSGRARAAVHAFLSEQLSETGSEAENHASKRSRAEDSDGEEARSFHAVGVRPAR